MAFFDKLNELTATVRDKTSDVIETQKLNAKINSEKSAIADLMKQIGEYCYNKHAAGEPTDPVITDLIGSIDTHYKAIQEVEVQLKSIKEETAAGPAGSSSGAASAAQPAAGTIFCGACGARNDAGTNFCGTCGAKMN
jgi:succinate dehydrogenase/fumarate reductase-like Fe-S protein